ncbi:phosphotransferase [Streptomyces sp. NBC_01077]|uniref:phosphotransferase family protein n=1 Tax=Streptomyces sp. NBC_01077 TaxID=2903746 RepID=UPI00386CF957|nr:phosphotransferase [Streptomyces sp. NBC_01077]
MTFGDHAALDAPTRAWLTERALPGLSLSDVRLLPGGFTNDMRLVTTRQGERYVLRRYLSSGTRMRRNNCAVESAVLERAAPTVPVVDVVASDPYGSATGRPALVYRFAEGIPLSRALAEHPSAAGAAELGAAVGGVLARIAAVRLPRPGPFHDPTLVPAEDGDGAADLPDFVERCLATGGAGHALTPAETDAQTPAEAHALTPAEADALRALAARTAHRVADVSGHSRLVHCDFNPKNVLVSRAGGRWDVVAVLDWEQAFSGSPLYDIGNMLRFSPLYPPAFVDGFVSGYRNAGGALPDDWRELSRILDLFTLADILTAPPDAECFAQARTVLLSHLSEE